MNTSVVSAAIIEGNLIIGLSDGSVINCGFVQGPQGLSGPQGPMGATGDNGTDGNTILTVAGTPGNEMGTDGDYAIDNINWRIYGPKSGGVWGKAKSMLPDPENMITNGREGGSGGGSMGGSGGGEGGGIIYTNTVQLTNPVITLLRSTGTYKIIPNAPTGTTNQEGANQWAFGSCFDNFDAAIPIPTGILPPQPLAGFIDNYDGRLWFNSDPEVLTLYVYKNGDWIPAAPSVGVFVNLSPIPPTRPDRPDGPRDGDLWFDTSPEELTLYVYSEASGAWIPAAPPTTLEGRVSEAEAIQIQIVQRLQANEVLTNFHSNEILTLRSEIAELEEKVNELTGIVKGSVARYTLQNSNGAPVSRPGELSTNTGFYSSVSTFSFGTADADGEPTKTMVNGDIIETFDAAENATNRYSITDASGAPTIVSVKYVSGNLFYVIGSELEVYIY